MLEPKPDQGVRSFVDVKAAMLFALLEEIPVAILGDAAETAAHRVQEASEHLIRVCSWAIDSLGLLSLSLGLYAAISGIKSTAGE